MFQGASYRQHAMSDSNLFTADTTTFTTWNTTTGIFWHCYGCSPQSSDIVIADAIDILFAFQQECNVNLPFVTAGHWDYF